jgi:predicted GNAT family N-acyltransferase
LFGAFGFVVDGALTTEDGIEQVPMHRDASAPIR